MTFCIRSGVVQIDLVVEFLSTEIGPPERPIRPAGGVAPWFDAFWGRKSEKCSVEIVKHIENCHT